MAQLVQQIIAGSSINHTNYHHPHSLILSFTQRHHQTRPTNGIHAEYAQVEMEWAEWEQ